MRLAAPAYTGQLRQCTYSGRRSQRLSPRLPMRFQQSSTSARLARKSLTAGLLARGARLQAAGAFRVALGFDQRGQVQQLSLIHI